MTVTTTTRFGQYIDTIVAGLNALPTFADPVLVQDGPSPWAETTKDVVFIGNDGQAEADLSGDSAIFDRGGYTIGNTSQLETVQLRCAVRCWSGDIAAKANRDRAIVLLSGVDTYIRTDPSLGLGADVIATLMPGSFYAEVAEGGGQARVEFLINIQGYLTST